MHDHAGQKHRGHDPVKAYPIVEIRWTDAVDMAGEWVELDKIKCDPMPSRTVGFLVGETPDAVVVAAVVNTTHAAHGIVIPRRMIDRFRYLKGKP